MHYAAGQGHTDVVLLLLDKGSPVNGVDRFDKTPLHWAADGGHVEAARVLIQHGADVHAQSEFGTPAQTAERNNHTVLYQLLKQHESKG